MMGHGGRPCAEELASTPAHVAGPAADGAGEEGAASGEEELECREGEEFQAELPECRDRPAQPTQEEQAWCSDADCLLKAGDLGGGQGGLVPIVAVRDDDGR